MAKGQKYPALYVDRKTSPDFGYAQGQDLKIIKDVT